jgi:hypothetical protein
MPQPFLKLNRFDTDNIIEWASFAQSCSDTGEWTESEQRTYQKILQIQALQSVPRLAPGILKLDKRNS